MSVCTLLVAAARGHGTYSEITAALDQVIASRPAGAAPYVRRALIHLENGAWQACLEDLERAERRQSADPAIPRLRGRALAAGGFPQAARAVLDDHLRAHPRDAAALVERARVLASLGLHSEAAMDFTEAARAGGGAEPDRVFEHVASLRAAGRLEEALRAVNEALPRNPRAITLVELAAHLEADLGRHADAARRVGAFLPHATVQEPLLARQASLLAQAGDEAASLRVWRDLRARIAALPPEKRASFAMTRLDVQAAQAIAALTQDTITAATSAR